MPDSLTALFTDSNKDCRISARLSDDRLKLFADAEKLCADVPLSRESLLALLSNHVDLQSIHLGVLDDIVCALNQGATKVENRRVASGQPPRDGIDGKFLMLIQKFRGTFDPCLGESGELGLKERHLFDNVASGQIVGRLYPPQPGLDGVDVLGRPIPYQHGEPEHISLHPSLAMRMPENAALSYQEIVALEDGYLTQEGNKLKIVSRLVIEGDLDFRWGNLDFIGQVRVSGDVMPGFSIKARRGIQVAGSVRGGGLIATEGPIEVQEHVYGGHGSMILSGRSFRARIVRQVNTEILGDIHIEKEALDSVLRTAGALLMPRGLLVGGKVFAVRGVEANIIGSESATRTIINLTSNVEASMAYARVLVALEVHAQEIKELGLLLGPLASDPERLNALPENLRPKMLAFYERLHKLHETQRSLQEQQSRMISVAKTGETLRVNFHSRLYPGVEIRAAGLSFSTSEPLAGPASLEFVLKQKKFTLGPLKALHAS